MRLATVCAWVCSGALLWAQAAVAQLPTARLYGVFPAGGQAGSRFELEVAGVDLDGIGPDAPARLVASHPGITAEPTMRPARLTEGGPQVVPNRFFVEIAPEVPPGTYELRVQGCYGLSNPRAFVVGTRPEIRELEPNHEPADATELALEAVANGVLDGNGDVDVYRLSLAAERTLIVCEARQLDSRAVPSLVLYDERGVQLDTATSGLAGRAILDVTPPQPAVYYVAVHDAAYGGDGMLGYVYRLRATTGPHVDLVFPPAVPAGQTCRLTLFGRNLGGTRADGVRIGGHALEQLAVEVAVPAAPAIALAGQPAAPTSVASGGSEPSGAAAAGLVLAQGEYAPSLWELAPRALDGFDYVFSTAAGAASPVRLFFAAAPIVDEREPNNRASDAQPLQPPCEVAGRFWRADRDWYDFEARSQQTFWIEVFAQRLGLAADPLLVVQQLVHDEQGKEQAVELASVDDLDDEPDQPNYTESKDPALLFVAPADGRYRLLVRDLSGNPAADPRHVYRLVIRPAQPDFFVAALPRMAGVNEDPNDRTPAPWPLVLRRGGVETIDLVLYRRDGFDAEVEVRVDSLPPGVHAAPAVFGPGVSTTSLALIADEDVAPGLAHLKVVARGLVGGRTVERVALAGTVPFDPRRPPLPRARASTALPLSLLDEQAPFAARLGEAQESVLRTSRAGRLAIPISLTRRGDFQGNVYFYLRGGPRGMQQLNELNLDGATATATLELMLPGTCPAGRYTLSLLGVAEVPYARNPQAAAAAATRKAAIEAALPQVQAAASRAAEVRAAAEQALAQARAQAEEARASGAGPEVLAAAESALAAAEEQLALAQHAESQAARAAEEAAEWFVEADRVAAELAQAAAQRGYGVAYPSSALTIDVAESPLELTVPSELSVTPGSSADLHVAIARLFGFAEGVSVELRLPGDVPGLTASTLYLEPHEANGVLRIEAAADASPGTYQSTLRFSLGFNGQGIEVARPLALTIAGSPSPDAAPENEHSP